MTVGKHCQRNPATARPEESLRDAAKRMVSRNVGCVVVIDSDGRSLGMLTDRDVVIRGLGRNCDLDATPVSAVMSEPLGDMGEAIPVARAITFMRNGAIRRLAVVDQDGRVSGIFTHDDALKIIATNLSIAAEAIEGQFPPQDHEPVAPREEPWELPIATRYRYEPVFTDRTTPISEIVEKMEEGNVGSVVVVDEKRIPVGIVTDRDLLRRVVAAGVDAKDEVATVMSRDVVTLPEAASLREMLERTREHRIRRVPLTNESGALVGIVALDDVIASLSTELEHLTSAVREELSRPRRFRV